MIRKLGYWMCLALFSYAAQAQDKKPSVGVIASVQPLFAFNNAIRGDLEIKSGRSFLNIVVCPEIYFGYVRDKVAYRDQNIDRLSGTGIGLYNKLDFGNKKLKPYVNLGVIYRNLTISYEDEGYVPNIVEGMKYYEYGDFTDELKINSYLLNANGGIQILSFEKLALDFYAGWGYKISSGSSMFNKREYKQEFTSYGYRGPMVVGGVKVGYIIK